MTDREILMLMARHIRTIADKTWQAVGMHYSETIMEDMSKIIGILDIKLKHEAIKETPP